MSEATAKRIYRQTERAASTAATRERILDAALEIGDPAAPLAAIAERAGVSERTVLRHFGDRNGLFAAVLEAGNERVVGERFDIPRGDVDAAAANLVGHYEDMGDRVIERLAQEGRDERIDAVLENGRRIHREWVGEKLGPLLPPGLDPRTRRRRLIQLVAVCDVYTWKLLRRDHRLGRSETEQAIAELIRGITERGDDR
ncbi:MAG TPA: TetR/AcrR family transcriptional regulator [Solirubrobacterales bacterium]|nr:TetR/AcrR family transcriptional regulator [Solirubrobacterales bacterium]